MDIIEKLKDKQKMFESFIYKAEKLESNTIEEMIRYKKELLSLTILQKKSSNDKISNRFIVCTHNLDRCSKILKDLNQQLHDYYKHNNSVINSLQEYEDKRSNKLGINLIKTERMIS